MQLIYLVGVYYNMLSIENKAFNLYNSFTEMQKRIPIHYELREKIVRGVF